MAGRTLLRSRALICSALAVALIAAGLIAVPWSPLGQRAAVADSGDPVALDASIGDVGEETNASISDDGRYVLYADSGSGSLPPGGGALVVYDRDTGTARILSGR